MRYIVEDANCNEIASFSTEKDREEWTNKNCYFDGMHWLIYDLSSINAKCTSRTVFWYEE